MQNATHYFPDGIDERVDFPIFRRNAQPAHKEKGSFSNNPCATASVLIALLPNHRPLIFQITYGLFTTTSANAGVLSNNLLRMHMSVWGVGNVEGGCSSSSSVSLFAGTLDVRNERLGLAPGTTDIVAAGDRACECLM